LRAREKIMRLQGDMAALFARALVIVDQLPVPHHLDARTIRLDLRRAQLEGVPSDGESAVPDLAAGYEAARCR